MALQVWHSTAMEITPDHTTIFIVLEVRADIGPMLDVPHLLHYMYMYLPSINLPTALEFYCYTHNSDVCRAG